MENDPDDSTPNPALDRTAHFFQPVPVKPRHDGWTPEKQIAFIEALAETACVDEACRHVGMTRQTAYALRRRPCAIAFRDAWDAALDYSLHQLEQAAIGRAIRGVPRPVFYKGEQVGEYRDHDERLAMFLLRYRRSARYGGWIDGEPSPQLPDDYYPPDETALRLGFHLDQIAEASEENARGAFEHEADEAVPDESSRAEGA